MSNCKSLGLLCQHFYPELVSTGLHMTELSTGLAEHGWNVHVFCAAPGQRPRDEHAREASYRGVQITRIRPWGDHRRSIGSRLVFGLTYTLACLWRVALTRKRLNGLIVTTNPPFLGMAAIVIRRLFRLPYLLIVYDVFPDAAVRLGILRAGSIVDRLWGRLTLRLLRDASRIVVIGRDMDEVIRSKLGGCDERITLIPNWSDSRQVYPIPRTENPFVSEHGLENRIVVQYAGNMGRTHNLEVLLDAAEILRDRREVVFQLVGDGAKCAQLQATAQSRALVNVQFLPYQPYERLAEMLSAANIAVVVLESGFEGLSVPSKTYGIMAAGVAVLGLLAPNSEIGRTLVENNCGIVIEHATGATIAHAIAELIQNPDSLTEMGNNARKAFLGNYSLSHAVERYDRTLQELFQPQ
jgi:glycosyltransferase involved in cell wall biosynthesis